MLGTGWFPSSASYFSGTVRPSKTFLPRPAQLSYVGSRLYHRLCHPECPIPYVWDTSCRPSRFGKKNWEILISGFILCTLFAFQSMSAKGSGNYPKAKKQADRALVLIVCNVIFTLCLSLLIIGLVSTYPSAYNSTKCRYLYYYQYYGGLCKLFEAVYV